MTITKYRPVTDDALSRFFSMVQQQGISPDDYSVQSGTVLVRNTANLDMLSLGFRWLPQLGDVVEHRHRPKHLQHNYTGTVVSIEPTVHGCDYVGININNEVRFFMSTDLQTVN